MGMGALAQDALSSAERDSSWPRLRQKQPNRIGHKGQNWTQSVRVAVCGSSKELPRLLPWRLHVL